MLHVHFGASAARRILHSESTRFRLNFAGLADAEGAIVAGIQRGMWSVQADSCTRWKCGGPVAVLFEFCDRIAVQWQGEYSSVSVFGNIPRNKDEYLATLDHGLWRCFKTRVTLSGII